MVESVSRFRSANRKIRVDLYILLQQPLPEPQISFPSWVNVCTTPSIMSLSKARNILISQADLSEGGEGIVAFPDDDAWYPDMFLQRLVEIFMPGDNEVDFFFCRYASKPITWEKQQPAHANLSQTTRLASSNTIFVRESVAARIGGFDELLGVGGRFNGGEDNDYAIRAFLAARRSVFIDCALVGHRDPDPVLRPKYYVGGLIAISRYWRRHPAGAIVLIRKLLVGACHVLARRLSLKDYFAAVQIAMKGVPRLERGGETARTQ